MPLTDKEKKYFYQKISTFRKGLQMLEEELGEEAPPVLRVTKRSEWKQDFINMYKMGDRRVPAHFKRKSKTKKTGTNQ